MNFIGKDEQECLELLLIRFFQQEHIKRRFRFFSDYEVYGCEKWMQIELFHFLHQIQHIPKDEIVKEEQFKTDKRFNDHREWQFVDITFRIEHKTYYIGVELKHGRHYSMSSIMKDVQKTSHMTPAAKAYFRQLFFVLVHPTNENYMLKGKDAVISIGAKLCFTIKIPKSNLSCTVFSNTNQ